MKEIVITKIDEVFVSVSAETSILKEIDNEFRYRPPNYRFNPRFGYGWNGYINLFNPETKLFYIGLLDELIEFIKNNNYNFKITGDFGAQNFSEHEARIFVKTLSLPDYLELRDYQLKYFITSVRNRRAICISPTNSGKSLIQYLLFRYFNKKTLLIVPNIQLVTQMHDDFRSYGYEGDIHLIKEGSEKNSDCQLTISTYQSIYNLKSSWFHDKEVILGDEVHTFKAKSLKRMMEKTNNSPIRIGVTGTIPEDTLSKKTIKGLFGPFHTYISSTELIERGYSSPINIKILTLNHLDSPYWNNSKKIDYEDEIPEILSSEKRIEFIKNLAISLKGNTFIMFREIEYGKKLYECIKKYSGVPLYYVDGKDKADARKKLVNIIENEKDSITICSTVFSTGINIKKINNLIFTRPSKSRVQIMQSIGRGLRVSPEKTHITLFDISDRIISDINNHTIEHRILREKMYNNEKFSFRSYSINL